MVLDLGDRGNTAEALFCSGAKVAFPAGVFACVILGGGGIDLVLEARDAVRLRAVSPKRLPPSIDDRLESSPEVEAMLGRRL